MNTISLWQPWAELMANGSKTIETRSWYCGKFGLMAIHASKHWDNQLESMCQSIPFSEALPLGELPRGCIVAIGEFYACERVTPDIAIEIERRHDIAMEERRLSEYFWGDFTAGRWMWRFRNIRAIEPVYVAGHQGIWQWDASAVLPQLVEEKLEPIPADHRESAEERKRG